MTDTLQARLEAIDAACERAASLELDKLFDAGDGSFRMPSPQAAEAVWLKLIARKEQEFIQEIARTLKPRAAVPDTATGKQASIIEAMVDVALADDRYVDRMQQFHQEAASKARLQQQPFDIDAKRLELIDATYQTGVQDALRRARQNVLSELDLYKQVNAMKEDTGFLSQWRQYSTLSPWRMIGTIALLSLTSYLIAFVIGSDAFRGLLEQFGLTAGTGL